MNEIPSHPSEAINSIMAIAKSRGISFAQAAETDAGRRILQLTEQVMKADTIPIGHADDATPGYLRKAAQEIASRDNISVERAFATLGRERPDLAKMYRSAMS